MFDVRRFTPDELITLVNSAVSKIDLMGPEGTARCTSDEIEAMATMLIALNPVVTIERNSANAATTTGDQS